MNGQFGNASFKKEMKWIGLFLLWCVLFGALCPWLVSATSTVAVFAGLAILLVCGYLTYRIVKNEYFTEDGKQ